MCLKELRNFAKSKGLSIVFKNQKYPDDFTIFIYDKSKQSRYLVGFDGNKRSNEYDLFRCCELAEDYIKNYNND